MNEQHGKLDKTTFGIAAGLPLQAASGGLEELRRNIQQLMDLEAIKQLKHAYFRCIDTANTEELATLFHPDVLVHFIGGSYQWRIEGRQAYVDRIGTAFNQGAIAHHNGHHPEIQLLSDTEATGIWYLADTMWLLNHRKRIQGTAIYWDRYLKVDGCWVIRETRYQRLYEINEQSLETPPLSAHYLGVHGRPLA